MLLRLLASLTGCITHHKVRIGPCGHCAQRCMCHDPGQLISFRFGRIHSGLTRRRLLRWNILRIFLLSCSLGHAMRIGSFSKLQLAVTLFTVLQFIRSIVDGPCAVVTGIFARAVLDFISGSLPM